MADRRPASRVAGLWRRLARRAYRTGLIGFGRLPHPVQRWVVRIASPSYTVGALLVLEHESTGTVLVLRQLHREGWTLPGGLLAHGETPAAGVVRETGEELGLTIDLDPEEDLPAATLVEPNSQRVDVIFHRRVDERPRVRPRGEAFRVDWRPIESLIGENQDPVTRDVLQLLRRAQRQ